MNSFRRAVDCATISLSLTWLGSGALADDSAPRKPPAITAPAPAADSAARLSALARDALARWRQPSADQLREQCEALRTAADALGAYLDTQGANGQAWKKYLLWNELSRHLRTAQPTVAGLVEVNARFSSGELGLERPIWANVRQALSNLLPTLRLIEETNARDQYDKQLGELAGLLAAPPHESAGYETPLAERRERIGRILGWLEDRGLAAELVAAARHELSYPNLRVRLSRTWLAAEIDAPFDQIGPVRQVILGALHSGTSHATGTTSLQFVPDDHRAVIEIGLAGKSHANTAGYVSQGRFRQATIHSRTLTSFQGRQQIEIDAGGIHLRPAEAQASVWTLGTSVSASGLGSNLVRRRVAESRRQAEGQSARLSEQALRQQLDAEVTRLLQSIDDQWPADGGKPLAWRRPYAPALQFSTTAETLSITGLQADPFQLAAPAPLAAAAPPADLAVQLHESWLNNRAQELLSGKTLTDDSLQTSLSEVLGWLPEGFDASHRQRAGSPAWSISLAKASPLAIHLADNVCEIAVSVDRFEAGTNVYPAMNITARYKVATAGHARLVLNDKLAIYPPGFVPGSGKRLGGRYQVYRRALEKRFSSLFPREISLDTLQLDEDAAQGAALSNVGLSICDGWLTLAYERKSRAR